MKGWRRISGALPQVDWTLTFDLQETAKPRFHTNHRRPTKQTAPCSSPFWVERSSGYPKYLASHEGWLNWPVTGSQLITGTLDRLKKKKHWPEWSSLSMHYCKSDARNIQRTGHLNATVDALHHHFTSQRCRHWTCPKFQRLIHTLTYARQ